MSGDDEDLAACLKGYGFGEEELNAVRDELKSIRTIPSTTIGRFMNRILNKSPAKSRSLSSAHRWKKYKAMYDQRI